MIRKNSNSAEIIRREIEDDSKINVIDSIMYLMKKAIP